jgi:hypothetical protein
MINFFRSLFSLCKKIFGYFLLFFIITFLVKNRNIVTVNFSPFGVVQTKMFILMLGFYLCGILTVLLIFSKRLLITFFDKFKNK